MTDYHRVALNMSIKNQFLFVPLDKLVRQLTQSVHDLEWSNDADTAELERLRHDLVYITQLKKDGHNLLPLF